MYQRYHIYQKQHRDHVYHRYHRYHIYIYRYISYLTHIYMYIYNIINKDIMYTKDIIDTKYIIYNTHKPETLKTPTKKPKVTDTVQAARTITKPDAPDKKINVLAQKKTLTTVLKKGKARNDSTHTRTLLCRPSTPPPPETPHSRPETHPLPKPPSPNPQTPTQKSTAKNHVFCAMKKEKNSKKQRKKMKT